MSYVAICSKYHLDAFSEETNDKLDKFVQVGALTRVRVSRKAAARARDLGFPEALVGCANNTRAVAVSKRAGVQEGGRAGGGQVGEVCGCAGGRADGWGAQRVCKASKLEKKEARRFLSVVDVSNEEEVEGHECSYIKMEG